ncbi:MAG: AraC family transcriptional regulator [Deltaproteobacteria bacterium]|nr:AraC family transcriptional regulator [Deltaproteobacteria bacterium]
MPGLVASRWISTELCRGVKEFTGVVRLDRGRAEWWTAGKVFRGEPGALQLKQPGDVHHDLWRDGPIGFDIVALPEVAALGGKVRPQRFIPAGDPRGAPFHRLHDAVAAGAERLELESAVAEATAVFASLETGATSYAAPVRRSIELLRARVADAVALDTLAAHAGIDKFHLCRAFRAQVGMPPHAYQIRLRIARAKRLLAGGVRPGEVASLVGFCDQSLLNRHFRRIVGTTPGRYARAR